MMHLWSQPSLAAVEMQMAEAHRAAEMARLARQSREPRASRVMAALRAVLSRRGKDAVEPQANKAAA